MKLQINILMLLFLCVPVFSEQSQILSRPTIYITESTISHPKVEVVAVAEWQAVATNGTIILMHGDQILRDPEKIHRAIVETVANVLIGEPVLMSNTNIFKDISHQFFSGRTYYRISLRITSSDFIEEKDYWVEKK